MNYESYYSSTTVPVVLLRRTPLGVWNVVSSQLRVAISTKGRNGQ